MKILGYDYKIDRSKTDEEMGSFGRFMATRQTIQIANNLIPQQAESTVLHEIIEAINYHMRCQLDESTIMTLEASLYQVLTANGVDLSPLMPQDG